MATITLLVWHIYWTMILSSSLQLKPFPLFGCGLRAAPYKCLFNVGHQWRLLTLRWEIPWWCLSGCPAGPMLFNSMPGEGVVTMVSIQSFLVCFYPVIPKSRVFTQRKGKICYLARGGIRWHSLNEKNKNRIVRWPAATEPRRGSGIIDLIGNNAIILGSMTFAHMTFAQRHLPRDICTYDVCPEGHLLRRHLHRKTFAQKDICTDDICTEDVCPVRHLPRKTFAQKTFAQKDSCPERHWPRKTFAQKTFARKEVCPNRRLPRKTFAQKDNCPDNVWLERHLFRNTIFL
jgi:hypothetical protein